jgi:hypothetical protein
MSIILWIMWTDFGNKKIEGFSEENTVEDGEGSGAETYLEHVKSEVVQLQDELLISKYKGEYTNILVQVDDYLNLAMLKQTLNLKFKSDGSIPVIDFKQLGSLYNAKKALNETMTYVDK